MSWPDAAAGAAGVLHASGARRALRLLDDDLRRGPNAQECLAFVRRLGYFFLAWEAPRFSISARASWPFLASASLAAKSALASFRLFCAALISALTATS